MAFVASVPRLAHLDPWIGTRNSPSLSSALVVKFKKPSRAAFGPPLQPALFVSPIYVLSQAHGGGGGAFVQRRVRCDDQDDNNGLFSSSFATLFGSKQQFFSEFRLSSNKRMPNLIFIRFMQQLRVCQILLAVNIAVFVIQILSGPGILMAGAKVNSAIANGQYYRLLSPMFLHASITHLGINSFSLYSTGPSVESWFGKNRFLWLYLVSGLCGNVLSFACTPTPAVGASGAIFGLVGASAVILARHRKLLGPRARRGLQSLAYIVVMNFGMGLSPGSRIDNFGHLGGFLGGIAYSYMFGPRFVTRRLRSGRTVLKDEPVSSMVMRDIRNRVHFIRRLLKAN